jgi:hydrogenase expression/formation protein HypD
LVSSDGNVKAQELMNKYFTKCMFKWRCLGNISENGLEIKDEFSKYKTRIIYKNILSLEEISDNNLCIYETKTLV